MENAENFYDVLVIGGGPAGLAAGLYCSRAKMSVVVIEKEIYGGKVATTYDIDNYPGAPENSTGASLSKRMKMQAEYFGTKFVSDEVTEVEFSEKLKKVRCGDSEYHSKTVIIASGSNPRPAGFKNEDKLKSRGISYCATCDADFFTDLDVAVVGGGDSAVTEAIYLSRFAKNVSVIHRRDSLRAAKSIQEKAFSNPKISFMWNSEVEEALGDQGLEGMIVKDRNTGESHEIKVQGCFVFIGDMPATDVFKGKIKLDEKNYIITNENMETNIPGVFAAGDIRQKTLRQIVTAVSDGAVAAVSAERYVEKFQ